MMNKFLFALGMLTVLVFGFSQFSAKADTYGEYDPIAMCKAEYRLEQSYCATLPTSQQATCLADARDAYDFCLMNN